MSLGPVEPTQLDLLKDAAAALYTAGDAEGAVEAWRGVLARAPNDLDANAHLAQILFGLRRLKEAIPHLRVMVNRYPSAGKPARRLAYCLQDAGETEQAVHAWRRVLELDPHDVGAAQQFQALSPPESARASPFGKTRPIVTVAAFGGGRQMFQVVRDPRIRLYETWTDDLPDPDIIVIPCGTGRTLTNAMNQPVPDRLRARMAEGKTAVVLDSSGEGVEHSRARTLILHRLLDNLGCSPANCVYLTQDRQYREDYQAHAAAVGLDPIMTVLEYDFWIWRLAQNFDIGSDAEALYQERRKAFRARPARRERSFISLNLTVRPTKVLFLLNLLRDRLWDRGFLSFGGFEMLLRTTAVDRAGFEQTLWALPGFNDMVAALAPLVETLDQRGQILLESEGDAPAPLAFDAPNMPEYRRSWFSVATETEMLNRPSRITEKAFKPLLNFHPVLTFGNPGSLKMLHNFGFATFEEVIDETYDQEPDPRARFDMVYREIVRLCGLEDEELYRIEQRIAEKLAYNARWGLTRFPGVYRGQRDAAMVDSLLRALRLD